MSEPRMQLVNQFKSSLISYIPVEYAEKVTDLLIIALSDYEISERCTDIVPYEDANGKLLNRYKGCLILNGRSHKTVAGYTRIIQKLVDFLNMPLTEVGTYEIRYFLACEKERGISNRSLENYRSYLSAFFTWMTEEEIIQKNPMNPVKTITYKNEIKKAFSDVEIDSLRSACKSFKERAIVEALLSTGVRVDELSKMKVSDIDFSKLEVMVLNGKGDSERRTYTTQVAAAHIKKYLADRREDGVWLFYNRNHKQLESGGIRKILNTIAERAGVENVHPHRFRRTFATNLSKKGMDIREIRKLLGHANINTTMKYICTDDESVQASYRKYA